MAKSKPVIGLDCEANALEGIRLLLHSRFEEMFELAEGALNWSDIEGVHDMRVASRRLRSALRDFKPYFKLRKHRRAGDSIKSLADSLGEVRDNDVAIAALEKLAASAPADVALGIEKFAAERRTRREGGRAALANEVADDRLSSLRAEFNASLEVTLLSPRANKLKTADDQADGSFRAVGRLIIRARMEELQGFSTSLYHPLKTKQLHRMRIAAKRLRYAIELVAECWNKQLDSFAKQVADLQTSLGELHDCDVWIAELGDLLEQHNAKSNAIAHAGNIELITTRRRASVWLLGHFARRRTNHYRDALTRWHDWESSEFFSRLEKCIQPLQANGESSSTLLSIKGSVAVDIDSNRAS